jgi:hypothetical protein
VTATKTGTAQLSVYDDDEANDEEDDDDDTDSKILSS